MANAKINDIDFKLIDNCEKVLEAERAAVLAALEEVGLFVEGEAKRALEMSPRRVDTGLLRNSIAYALSGEIPAIGTEKTRKYKADHSAEAGVYRSKVPSTLAPAVFVGTAVEYAPYVHEGTRKMPPNRFIKNAIELNAEQIKRKFEEKLSALS